MDIDVKFKRVYQHLTGAHILSGTALDDWKAVSEEVAKLRRLLHESEERERVLLHERAEATAVARKLKDENKHIAELLDAPPSTSIVDVLVTAAKRWAETRCGNVFEIAGAQRHCSEVRDHSGLHRNVHRTVAWSDSWTMQRRHALERLFAACPACRQMLTPPSEVTGGGRHLEYVEASCPCGWRGRAYFYQ